MVKEHLTFYSFLMGVGNLVCFVRSLQRKYGPIVRTQAGKERARLGARIFTWLDW